MTELTPRKVARINRAALAIALVSPKVEVDRGNGYRIGRMGFEGYDEAGKVMWVFVVTCSATNDPDVGYRRHEIRKVRGSEELYAGEGYAWLDSSHDPVTPPETLDGKPAASVERSRETIMRLFSPTGGNAFHAGVALVDEAFEAVTNHILAQRGQLPEGLSYDPATMTVSGTIKPQAEPTRLAG